MSPPHPTDAREPLNDALRDEDFLRTQSNGPSPRQQSSHSQQRRISFCQYHSESDLPSLASQPPLCCPFSSTIEVQRQKQWRSPQHAVIPVLPSRSSATFSADQRPRMDHSAIRPSGNSSCADGVIPTARIVTRGGSLSLLLSLIGLRPTSFRPVFPPHTAEDPNVSPVLRYPPTFHDSFSDTIPHDQLGSSGSILASNTAPEDFGNEMCEWSANGTEASEHARHVNNSCKGDTSANAVLMFVGPLRLTLVLIMLLICPKDGPFCPNRRIVYHGKLQNVVIRFWRPDIASLPSLEGTHWCRKWYSRLSAGLLDTLSCCLTCLCQRHVADEPCAQHRLRPPCNIEAAVGTQM